MRDLVEPGAEPHDIDRRGGRHVLELRFGASPVARTSEAEGADSLRERPFDASAVGVERGERRCLLPRSARQERLVLRTRLQREAARSGARRGAGAAGASGAGEAVGGVKVDMDHGALAGGVGFAPAEAGSALWADDPVVIPVNLEVLGRQAARHFGLPLVVVVERTHEIDVVAHVTLNDIAGAGVAGIHELLSRQEIARGEGILDAGELAEVRGRCNRRLHLRDGGVGVRRRRFR